MMLYIPVGDRADQAHHRKKKCSTSAKLMAVGLLFAACFAWLHSDVIMDKAATIESLEDIEEMFFKDDQSGSINPIDTDEVDKHIRDESGMLKLDLDWGKASPPFYMRHESSNRYIHPREGESNPNNNVYISLYHTKVSWARWKYIPFTDYEGYGVIQHVDSGKFLHPFGGSANPRNGELVVVYTGYHFACVFSFL